MIAICGVHMAESLLTRLVFTFHCVLVGRYFVSSICKLKPKKKHFLFKKPSFQPWCVCLCVWHRGGGAGGELISRPPA